jgi:hypothetical protein
MVKEGRWLEARSILSDSKYDKVSFKKIFNAYGDNIYYSDPDRANVYLGGGAMPRSEQSLAYLLRKSIDKHRSPQGRVGLLIERFHTRVGKE